MEWPSIRQVARAYLMSIAFWCGFSVLMGFQFRPPDRNNFWPSLASMLEESALRGLALAVWTPPLFALVGKYINYSRNRLRYVLLWSLGAIPFVFLNISIVWAIVPPYDEILHRFGPRTFQWWGQMIRGGFADHMFIYTAIVAAAHAYEYLKRLRREERERYEYQQALAASELQALKMQLHPHFLFNTLHGISTLIESDARSAKAMILKLSNLLRTVLDRDRSDLIPLETELKFAREYLDLEKMRFGSRLRIDWNVATETGRLLVPQMILQPLVENAIRHGIAPSREGGWIEVGADATNGTLNLQVRNSVGGNASNGTGVGLRNVEARLKSLFPSDSNMQFSFAEDRTATAKVTLPVLKAQPGAPEGHGPTVTEGDRPCEFSSSMTSR